MVFRKMSNLRKAFDGFFREKTLQILQIICSNYDDSDLGFMRIDDLWNKVKDIQTNLGSISFKEFGKTLLYLIHNHIDNVEPMEGMSNQNQKVIYDSSMKKYFHYIKINQKIRNYFRI